MDNQNFIIIKVSYSTFSDAQITSKNKRFILQMEAASFIGFFRKTNAHFLQPDQTFCLGASTQGFIAQ
jgi:hypothetical protein